MLKLYISLVMLIAFSLCANAQVEMDKHIELTGSGSDAKVSGIEAVEDADDATNKAYVDSAVATATASAGGVGFDVRFPDGFDGMDPVTYLLGTYTVPSGKTLYVTSLTDNSNSTREIEIDGMEIRTVTFHLNASEPWTALHQPMLVGASSTIECDGCTNVGMNGFLINTGVTPVTIKNLSSSPYTVPSGKILVILNAGSPTSSAPSFSVNGTFVSLYDWGSAMPLPLFVDEGDILSCGSNDPVINGYLMDK